MHTVFSSVFWNPHDMILAILHRIIYTVVIGHIFLLCVTLDWQRSFKPHSEFNFLFHDTAGFSDRFVWERNTKLISMLIIQLLKSSPMFFFTPKKNHHSLHFKQLSKNHIASTPLPFYSANIQERRYL